MKIDFWRTNWTSVDFDFNFIANKGICESDSIFPQWIRQTTEIWVNGDITDAEYLALIENVLNNGILPIEIVNEEKILNIQPRW